MLYYELRRIYLTMNKVYVIRHAAYTGRGREETLTDAGVRQAELAASKLLEASEGPWQLLASGAGRAAKTAEEIGRIIGATPFMSTIIEYAGEEPETAAEFENRINAAMLENSVEYNEQLPLAVVGHLPLLCCVAGSKYSEVSNGEVLLYDPQVWDGSAGAFM